jgi:hypothetical protein
MEITRRLAGVLGKRAFVGFGVVTFLVAALLATVNLSSRYALKLYVEDQLRRTPWDLALYQAAGSLTDDLPARVRSVKSVSQVESMAFLRAQMPEEGGGISQEVDGQPLVTPWLCVMAATDPSLLPPQWGQALADSASASAKPDGGAVLTLIGPERSMGNAFLSLQGAKHFTVTVDVNQQKRTVFTTPLDKVIRLDHDELNRWLMDQTGSVSFVPYIGVILLMPYDVNLLNRFDTLATGVVPAELIGPGEQQLGHVQTLTYVPETTCLVRIDRQAVISGWDIQGSLDRLYAVRQAIKASANPGIIQNTGPNAADDGAPGRQGSKVDYLQTGSTGVVIDSTAIVLLQRMNKIAQIIGLVTLIVALPLLWIAWVLAVNLARLLMLNERRTLGLMRLRGIPGKALGRAFLISIVSGGFIGGMLGLIAGSVIPLLVYEHGRLPLDVLFEGRQILLFSVFLIVTLALALLVSRRLVRYATTISPLEASARVAESEATRATSRFGPLQIISLVLGAYTLSSWVFGFSPPAGWLRTAGQVLDFVGLPLFVYGIATLVASRRQWIQAFLSPLIKPVGGPLGLVALRHLSLKPHRTISFLVIVAMAATVCLYPTVTGLSFENKEVRGAHVQMGSELQLIYNSPDLAAVDQLQGELGPQLAALGPGIRNIVDRTSQMQGVQSATYVLEALLPEFYLPGYGMRGVPLYLIGDPDRYQQGVYSEPELGISQKFDGLLAKLKDGQVAVTPQIADFWRLQPGTDVLMGADPEGNPVFAPTAGTLAFLPGTPPRTVTDRQGYVQARVDYLNHLFSSNAYLVADADSPRLAHLRVLVSRVIVLVKTADGVAPEAIQSSILGGSGVAPLEVHTLAAEVRKVGSDMFIMLALQNLRIYLLGGLFLALIAIMAVASANYAEDKRTMALLRIRGASPLHIWRFLVAMLLSPALIGLVLGALVALAAGFGLSNYVWKLREIKTAVQLLPGRLVFSGTLAWIILLFVVMLVGAMSLFSLWIFRRTARERVQEA